MLTSWKFERWEWVRTPVMNCENSNDEQESRRWVWLRGTQLLSFGNSTGEQEVRNHRCWLLETSSDECESAKPWCWIAVQPMGKKSGITDVDFLKLRAMSMSPLNSGVEIQLNRWARSQESQMLPSWKIERWVWVRELRCWILRRRTMSKNPGDGYDSEKLRCWVLEIRTVSKNPGIFDVGWKFERWVWLRETQVLSFGNSNDEQETQEFQMRKWKFERWV